MNENEILSAHNCIKNLSDNKLKHLYEHNKHQLSSDILPVLEKEYMARCLYNVIATPVQANFENEHTSTNNISEKTEVINTNEKTNSSEHSKLKNLHEQINNLNNIYNNLDFPNKIIETKDLRQKANELNAAYNNLDCTVSFSYFFKEASWVAALFIFTAFLFGGGILLSFFLYSILIKFNINQNFALCITIFISTFFCCTISFSELATIAVQEKIRNLKEKLGLIIKEHNDLIEKQENETKHINNYLDTQKEKIQIKQNRLTELFNAKQEVLNANIPSYPWIANLYADLHYIYDEETANHLRNKKNPAIKASQELSNIAKEKRELMKKYKMLEYQLNYYEKIFPWLEDFKEVDTIDTFNSLNNFDDAETDEYSRLKKWLSPEEYQKLSSVQKYQLALERYKNRKNKSNWDVGIEYERYIGYLYELKGYKVIYNGALEGLSDFGRDIIAEDKNKFLIIQCKYWKKEKTIHEKHIFQLHGTMVLKQLETKKDVVGLFITSASLSETAKKVAKKLKIEVVENKPMDNNYPCIKCNVNRQTGEKIYHLPFDQQYDKIIIESKKGEKYVNTVQEAEDLGFRRASKWISSLD